LKLVAINQSLQKVPADLDKAITDELARVAASNLAEVPGNLSLEQKKMLAATRGRERGLINWRGGNRAVADLAGRGFERLAAVRVGAEQVERQRCGRIALVAETLLTLNGWWRGKGFWRSADRIAGPFRTFRRRLQWPNGA
jgi:hypothetical protein